MICAENNLTTIGVQKTYHQSTKWSLKCKVPLNMFNPLTKMFDLLCGKYAQDKARSCLIVAVIITSCKGHLKKWWLAPLMWFGKLSAVPASFSLHDFSPLEWSHLKHKSVRVCC